MSWDFSAELKRFGPSTSHVQSHSLSFARAYCAYVCRSHYENFSVASMMLPRKLRPHFHAVYAYCRWADDLADETTDASAALAQLNWWRNELLSCYSGDCHHPVMLALRQTIQQYQIPPRPFLDLIDAFEQDQKQKSYTTFLNLLHYCQRSANPVGHLVLYLFDCFDEKRAALSDEVCTGLQLANFWQDVARDLDIGRVYLPIEDRLRFQYPDADLHARRYTQSFRALLEFEVERTRHYFKRGKPLLQLLPRAVRVDVDLFIRGGEAILNAIETQQFDVWSSRPKLSKTQKLRLLANAVVASWLR